MTEHAAPKTLGDLFADLWHAKMFLLVGALVGGICAYVFIYSAKPYYKAEMTISPANPMNGAEVSSLLADDNLFAIRYLVQRVGVANSSDFMRFENMYAGPSVAELLLQDEAIMAGLDVDKAFPFSKAEQDWSAAKLAGYIQDRVQLENVGSTSLRTMSYEHPSREFGMYFLHHIHRLTDEMIRMNIRQGATKRVAYLRDAVDDTGNPEHKRALTNLLLEQERLKMLVTIESPYAAAVVEPASVSARATWPDPMLTFPAFILIGMALGFAFSNMRGTTEEEMIILPETAEEPARTLKRRYGYWWKMDHTNANQSAARDKNIEAAE